LRFARLPFGSGAHDPSVQLTVLPRRGSIGFGLPRIEVLFSHFACLRAYLLVGGALLMLQYRGTSRCWLQTFAHGRGQRSSCSDPRGSHPAGARPGRGGCWKPRVPEPRACSCWRAPAGLSYRHILDKEVVQAERRRQRHRRYRTRRFLCNPRGEFSMLLGWPRNPEVCVLTNSA
jgi:hypothetical protein